MEYSNLFVCLMGIGTVFIGLICIIILVKIMSGIVRKADKSGKAAVQNAASGTPAVQTAAASAGAVTPQMAAAVSAVLAEEMGTDVSGIRIVSFKKVNS